MCSREFAQGTRLAVDKIEGEVAMCEVVEPIGGLRRGEEVQIEASKLPEHTKEGSILLVIEKSLVLDDEYEAFRRQQIKAKLDRLFGRC